MFIRYIDTPEKFRQKQTPELQCDQCGTVHLAKSAYRAMLPNRRHFCNKACSNLFKSKYGHYKSVRTCAQCLSEFEQKCRGKQIQKFCSSSCRSTYVSKRKFTSQPNATCEICQEPFNDPRQTCKFCPKCAPNNEWLRTAKRYKFSKAQYEALKLAQDNKCKICAFDGSKKKLVVDHDHVTNLIRGLLCYRCNFAMGVIDNKELHVKLLAYVNDA